MIGHCARCGGEVWLDPLEEVWWCACPPGLNPLMGTTLSPAQGQSLWDGVRRRRKDYVDPDEEAEAELDVVVPPEVTMLDMDPDDASLPASARRMAKTAVAHGWEVRTTYSRGTPTSANGKSKAVTVKEYLTGEDGQPLMTPPSKELPDGTRRFPNGQPKFRNVSTGEPQVIDVIVLRMRRGSDRLFASWEDGRLDLCLRADPLTILNNTTIKEALTDDAQG